MADIFEHAYPTISVVRSEDGVSGFFGPRGYRTADLPLRRGPGQDSKGISSLRKVNHVDELRKSVLNQRTRGFQERRLSRRIFSFTEYSVYF
jgi:hypothetical protein